MSHPIPPVLSTPAEMQALSAHWHRQDLQVGLVPTMGYLHEGHLSLVRRCLSQAQRTVVSIFVNPLQFGPQEDYEVYPRDMERDLSLLAELDVDAVFHPRAETFYAPDHSTFVEVEGLTRGLCGAHRPGHFRGVTTVVTKLFNAVRPDLAVFGQKDYQQAAVIQRMVRDLDMGIRLLIAPTVREPDGLAMSSRNTRLNAEERARAPVIYQALSEARRAVKEGRILEGPALAQGVRARIAAELSEQIDYVEVVDPESLEPVQQIQGPVVIAVAVRLPRVRLIDNIRAEPPTG